MFVTGVRPTSAYMRNISTELKCQYLKTESHFKARLDMGTRPLNTMNHPLLINSLHPHIDPDERPQVPLAILVMRNCCQPRSAEMEIKKMHGQKTACLPVPSF